MLVTDHYQKILYVQTLGTLEAWLRVCLVCHKTKSKTIFSSENSFLLIYFHVKQFSCKNGFTDFGKNSTFCVPLFSSGKRKLCGEGIVAHGTISTRSTSWCGNLRTVWGDWSGPMLQKAVCSIHIVTYCIAHMRH